MAMMVPEGKVVKSRNYVVFSGIASSLNLHENERRCVGNLRSWRNFPKQKSLLKPLLLPLQLQLLGISITSQPSAVLIDSKPLLLCSHQPSSALWSFSSPAIPKIGIQLTISFLLSQQQKKRFAVFQKATCFVARGVLISSLNIKKKQAIAMGSRSSKKVKNHSRLNRPRAEEALLSERGVFCIVIR